MQFRLKFAFAALAIAAHPAAAQTPRVIQLSDQQMGRLGVNLQPVAKATAVALVDLTGRVIRAPSGVSTIIAPFAGAVTKVHALPGSMVKAGEPIVTVASRDYATSLSLLKQAEAEASAAQSALARQQQLVDFGLAPRSSLEEAVVRAARASAQAQESRALTAGASGAVGQAGGYVVRAPASGRLSRLNVQVGDSLDAMAPLASLTTSEALWIEFHTPARLIGRINPGDLVALPGGLEASIVSVTDVIDPSTRSAKAIAVAPASFRAFEGQLVRAKISRATETAALVNAPARSIVQIDGVDHVFRRTPDGFAPMRVDVVGRTAEAATISGGLQPGDEVAASALTELKALARQVNK